MGRSRAPALKLAFAGAAGILCAAALPTPMAIAMAGAALLAALCIPKKNDLPAYLAAWAAFLLAHALASHHRETAPRWAELEQGQRPLATITGSIRNITPPKPTTSKLWNYELRTHTITTGGETTTGNWRILLSCPDPDLGFGDQVTATGTYQIPPSPRNPHSFDRRSWVLGQGYAAQLVAAEPASPAEPSKAVRLSTSKALGATVRQFRGWLSNTITAGLGENNDVVGVLRAITLGDRGGLPRALEENFQLSGTLHLFAVSGLHVAMVAAIILAFTQLLRLPRPLSFAVVLTGLLLYTMATGMRPSATRAATMILIYWGATLFDRNPSLLNSLGLAALLLLASNTWNLFSIGFQLSFAVMLGIGLLGAPLRRRFRSIVQPDPFIPRVLLTPPQRTAWAVRRTLSDNIAISLGAWAGSAVPILLYFRLFTPSVVLANLLLIYPAFAILWVAGLSLMAKAVGLTWFSITANHANWFLVKAVASIAALCAAIPGGHFFLPKGQLARPPGQLAKITILDIPSSGAATHLAFRGSHWLIDCGGPGSFYDIVLPHLREAGASPIDGAILTHGDSRHIGGAIPLRETMPSTPLWKNTHQSHSPIEEEIAQTLAPPPQTFHRGQHLQLAGQAHARVLYPPPDLQPRLADDGCAVILVQVGNWRLLFVGDTGLTAEYWLLKNEPDLHADVLIMGRHSGDYCGDLGFIRAVGPELIIATNHTFPENQRIPHAWREKIKAEGIPLLDQSRQGAVTLDIRRGSLGYQTAAHPETKILQTEKAGPSTP